MKLAFVHIPKAAGTSLKKALIANLGEEGIAFQYDRPMADGRWMRNVKCLFASLQGAEPSKQVVFGHFLVGKFARPTPSGYMPRPGVGYATIVREPLQRAISHYHFWQRTYLGGHRVWERFTRESWSLERFLFSREHANFQSQFLWKFPLANFDFLGLAERYEESLWLLGQTFPFLGNLDVRLENYNPDKSADDNYQIDPQTAAAFRKLHWRDYALYEEAKRIFDIKLRQSAAKRTGER
jgi:hypothetical protein